MTRLVPVAGQIIMPEGHTYADATWRYGTEVAGGWQIAGGAQRWKVVETAPGLGELRTLDDKIPQVLVHDLGDLVPHSPWAQLEVRFRGTAIGFEKRIPLVLTREETALRIDKQMARTRLVELTRDNAVFLNWRFDAENYILVDGVHESLVALTPKDKFKGHKHAVEDVTNLKALLDGKASVSTVQALQQGKADLINGKIPTSQLPGAALMEIFFVASEAAMLALRAEPGDIAVRTDKGNLRFELTGDPTNIDHWSPQYPANESGQIETGVLSINGQRGDVILSAVDVGAAAKDHTHTAAQITDFAAEVDKRAQFNVTGGTGPITTTWDSANRRQVLGLSAGHAAVKAGVFASLSGGTGITVTKDEQGNSVIAVSGSGGWVDWNDVANKPMTYPVENHAARHRTGGPDALTAADIGAAPASHTHTLASLGAAAAQHQHAPGDMPELAEFVRDTIGATLAGSGGISVVNNDEGDQIMISANGVVGVTLEEADGKPSLSVSKIIVPPGSLTANPDGSVSLSMGGGNSGGSVGEAYKYTPKYQRIVSATNPFPYRTRVRVTAVIRTAFAQDDGRDFRVYTSAGILLPSAVNSVVYGPNYRDYGVVFVFPFDASEAKTFTIKYGDERAMPQSNLNMGDLYELRNRGETKTGKMWLYQDSSMAYVSPDFQKGPQIISGLNTPSEPGFGVIFNETNYTEYTYQSGGFQFSSNANSLTLQVNNQTYGLNPTYHALGDGYAWDIRFTNDYQTYITMKACLRYRHPGIWIFTLMRFVYQWSPLILKVNGTNYQFPIGSVLPVETDPTTWQTYVLSPANGTTATVGDETAIQ